MTQVEVKEKNKKLEEDLKSHGCHYGRAKRFTHSSMKQFLLKFEKRGNLEFFNLNKTIEGLNSASNYIVELIKEQKLILFVGAKPAAEKAVEKIAKEFNMPYLNYKWVGGFLTNFQTIKTRIEYFKSLLQKEESGEIEEYPPADKKRLLRELDKMKKVYSGVKELDRIPDAIFIIDLKYPPHNTARNEAIKMNLPIIAICGSDNDTRGVKIVIPANDKAPSSINFLIDYLINKIKEKLQAQNG